MAASAAASRWLLAAGRLLCGMTEVGAGAGAASTAIEAIPATEADGLGPRAE
ncbi:hypothetical protein P5W99_10030 [Paraburkholderia sp. A3BS-1L]|uniref:hypothetical protein n=1 Tax=unclassified Paraburkholderia TaxID=2615204 RepID=UPI003DA86A62